MITPHRKNTAGSDHGAAANGAVQPGGSTLDPVVPVPANSRITQALQLALARKPSKDELARLEQLLADELRLLSSQPAAELAAYTTLCQVIMNLDEFVTRE